MHRFMDKTLSNTLTLSEGVTDLSVCYETEPCLSLFLLRSNAVWIQSKEK